MKTATLLLSAGLLGGLAGCRDKPAPITPKPPVVEVQKPLVKDITRYEVVSGQTQPVQTVEIRARVNGVLEEIAHEEGQPVKKGDLIDQVLSLFTRKIKSFVQFPY